MSKKYTSRMVCDVITTDTITSSSEGGVFINESLALNKPYIPDLNMHKKDGLYNLYLGKPSPSYAVYLTEGQLIKHGVISSMEEEGTYHIRNIFRGYHNLDRTRQYPTPYDLIVRDTWDDLSFSSTIRFINIGADRVNLKIDGRHEIETRRIDMDQDLDPELLRFTNWCMTPIIGLNDKGSESWSLDPGHGVSMDIYFMREAIYVEKVTHMKADIHNNERCLGNRFRAYMEEYTFTTR